eukprot:1160643-Pelagomonas_calceolata.AAC.1
MQVGGSDQGAKRVVTGFLYQQEQDVRLKSGMCLQLKMHKGPMETAIEKKSSCIHNSQGTGCRAAEDTRHSQGTGCRAAADIHNLQ